MTKFFKTQRKGMRVLSFTLWKYTWQKDKFIFKVFAGKFTLAANIFFGGSGTEDGGSGGPNEYSRIALLFISKGN